MPNLKRRKPNIPRTKSVQICIKWFLYLILLLPSSIWGSTSEEENELFSILEQIEEKNSTAFADQQINEYSEDKEKLKKYIFKHSIYYDDSKIFKHMIEYHKVSPEQEDFNYVFIEEKNEEKLKYLLENTGLKPNLSTLNFVIVDVKDEKKNPY